MADTILPEGAALSAEKLRAEIAREREQAETLMRQRLNWAAQEQFWKANTEFWARETRLSRARNYIAVAAIAAAIASTLTGVLISALRHWP